MENTNIAILGKPAEEEQLDWVEQLQTIRLVTGITRSGKSRPAKALNMHDVHNSEKTGGLNDE
jgi:hypothetical protein